MTSTMSAPMGTIPTFSMGDRLRKAREVADLKQGELAERIGISRTAVVNAERGAHPRELTLRAWSMATGVSLTWIKTGMAPSSGDDGADQGRLRESNPRPIHYKAISLAA